MRRFQVFCQTLVHSIQEGGISVSSENMFVHNNFKHGRKVRRGENGLVVENANNLGAPGGKMLKFETQGYSMHANNSGCKFSVSLFYFFSWRLSIQGLFFEKWPYELLSYYLGICLRKNGSITKVWVAKVRARTHMCDVRSHVCVCVRNDLWNKCAKCVRAGLFSTGHTHTCATTHFPYFPRKTDGYFWFYLWTLVVNLSGEP